MLASEPIPARLVHKLPQKVKKTESVRLRLRQSKITTMESELESLLDFNERESIDDLFNEAFRELTNAGKVWT